MKKLYVVITYIVSLLLLLCSCGKEPEKKVEEPEVRFEKLTVDEGLAKAVKENKLLFIDFYTDNCGGCEKMDKEVFKDPVMAGLLNQKAVCIKVNGGKEATLAKKYKVYGYPTVMVLENSGEERDRLCGYNGKEEIVTGLKDFIAGKNTLQLILKELKSDNDNIDVNIKIARKYVKRFQGKEAYKYYSRVVDLDPEDTKGYKAEADYEVALYHTIYEKKSDLLEKYLVGNRIEKYNKEGYHWLIRLYRKSNIPKTVDLYEQAITRLPKDFRLKNDYAWYICQNKIKDKYQTGIDMAVKATEAAPEKANQWDTLAWLYYEKGEKKRAVEAIKNAVKYASEDRRDRFKERLKQIQGQSLKR